MLKSKKETLEHLFKNKNKKDEARQIFKGIKLIEKNGEVIYKAE